METDVMYSDNRQIPEDPVASQGIEEAATPAQSFQPGCGDDDARNLQPGAGDVPVAQKACSNAVEADAPDIERFANDVDPYVEGRDQVPDAGEQEDTGVADDDPASSHNIELGRKGERAACRFLERKGYEILERNWNCPFGEADIICSDGDSVHFVEVKTRSGIEKGLPSDAVTPEKRAKYEKIALSYLQNHWECEIRVSFDIISILATGNGRAILRFHENAFSEADR